MAFQFISNYEYKTIRFVVIFEEQKKLRKKLIKYFICLFIYFQYCCCCCCCCSCVLAVAGHLFELSFEFLIHLQKNYIYFRICKKQQKHKILYTLYFRSRGGIISPVYYSNSIYRMDLSKRTWSVGKMKKIIGVD